MNQNLKTFTSFDCDQMATELKYLVKELTKIENSTVNIQLHGLGVRDYGDHFNAIEKLYNLLTDDGQKTFKAALGIALAEAHPLETSADAARILLHMIGYSAAFESVPSLGYVFADDATWCEQQPDILIDVISILKGLGESPRTYEIAKKLATSKWIAQKPWLIFDVYEALLRGSSDNWADDFALLNKIFEALISHAPRYWKPVGSYKTWFDYRMQLMIKQFMSPLSLLTIAKGLESIDKRYMNVIEKEKPLYKLINMLFDENIGIIKVNVNIKNE